MALVRHTLGLAEGQLSKEALGCLAKVADHGRGTALASILGFVEDRGADDGESVSNGSKPASLALLGRLAVRHGGALCGNNQDVVSFSKQSINLSFTRRRSSQIHTPPNDHAS